MIAIKDFEEFLYKKDEGLLNKYHFGKGLDLKLLDKFYDILEDLKLFWRDKEFVPKEIVFQLVSIIPCLYRDLEVYNGKDEYYVYEELIYKLDVAISMCLNPNVEDVHFSTPLRDL